MNTELKVGKLYKFNNLPFLYYVALSRDEKYAGDLQHGDVLLVLSVGLQKYANDFYRKSWVEISYLSTDGNKQKFSVQQSWVNLFEELK